MRQLTRSLRRTLRTALRGLGRNRMRSALTTLGIVIGVAAVIAMMEIGQGSSKSIQKTIASMGAANIIILPGAATFGSVVFGAGSTMTLTPGDCQAILDSCPAVRAVAPIVRSRTQVIYGNRNWQPDFIYGTTPEFLDVREWPLEDGVPFTDADVVTSNRVCLLAQTVVRELFQDQSPIGKEIRINNIAFRVIGVLSRKGANMVGMDQDNIILAPWTSIKFRVTGRAMDSGNQSAVVVTQSVNTLSNLYPGKVSLYPDKSATEQTNNPLPVRFITVDQIVLAARSSDQIANAIDQLTKVLRQRHRIPDGFPDDFTIRDMTEVTNMLSSTSFLMSKLLLSVALISLVVGGVGIMNIMLVSVTERTREIGIRKAIGARRGSIMTQFLIESIVVSCMGGVIGIAIGFWGAITAGNLMSLDATPDALVVLAAFAVSAVVGIFFGWFPAHKASKLNPIEALRFE